MTFPAGVTTATVTLGVAGNFAGDTADIDLTVTPTVPYLIHAATGMRMLGTPITVRGRDEVSVTLPHTGQSGFTDGTIPVTGWQYVARGVFTDRAGNRTRFAFAFDVPVGETAIDLDMVTQSAIPPPVTGSWVASVMGHTGVVTTPQVEAALHAAGWSRVVVSDTPPAGDPNTVWVRPEPLE